MLTWLALEDHCAQGGKPFGLKGGLPYPLSGMQAYPPGNDHISPPKGTFLEMISTIVPFPRWDIYGYVGSLKGNQGIVPSIQHFRRTARRGIWMFPKIVVPPNHKSIHFGGFSSIFGNTHISWEQKKILLNPFLLNQTGPGSPFEVHSLSPPP